MRTKIIITSKYWFTVLRRAWATAAEKSDMKSAALAVILAWIAFFILLILSINKTLPENLQILVGDFSAELRIGIVSLLLFVLLGFVIFAFALIYMPAKIHDEQETDKTRFEKQIENLEESAKPKLELYFDPDHESSVQIDTPFNNTTVTFHRIFVHNKSSIENVEQINVKLIGIKPENPEITYLPTELEITNHPNKRLNSGDRFCADVIIVDAVKDGTGKKQYGLRFAFENEGLKARQQVFQMTTPFEFVVAAYGMNTSPVYKTFTFYRNELSRRNPYGFQEKSDDQAKT